MTGEVFGTSLGPYYHAPQVQAVLRRAVTELDKGGGYEDAAEAAKDVLDVLYTAMMFGAFKDWENVPSRIVDFPMKEDA